MKHCKLCNLEKELSEFSKDKVRKDGLNRYCRDCCKKQLTTYIQKKKEQLGNEDFQKFCELRTIKRNEKRRESRRLKRESDPKFLEKKLRKSDPEYQKEIRRKKYLRKKERFELWCKTNPELCESRKKIDSKKSYEYVKRRMEIDPEYKKLLNKKNSESRKRRMEIDPEYKKLLNRKNYERKKRRMKIDPEFRERVREKLRKKERNKWEKDSLYKFKKMWRNSMKRSIKNGYNDDTSAHKILGANHTTVRTHIESLFLEGMFWENYGEWHMDHIIPLSIAKTEEEVLKLLHYTNVQPLWAKDNLEKSNEIPEGYQIPF